MFYAVSIMRLRAEKYAEVCRRTVTILLLRYGKLNFYEWRCAPWLLKEESHAVVIGMA